MKSAFIYFLIVLLCLPLSAANYTVKAAGGGDFSTLVGCAAQQSANGSGVSDTCTVYAGTYNENVTIPAGSSGHLKIFNVNGSDTVSIVGTVTLNSFTQLNGNCPEVQGTVITTAACGFFISRTASPTSSCISVSASVTDFTIQDNNLYACAPLSTPSTSSFGHIRGNAITYPDTTVANMPANGAGSSGVGPATIIKGNHMLIEYNDLSHNSDSLSSFFCTSCIIRHNLFHDMQASDCDGGAHSSNCHIDLMEAEPNIASSQDVFEMNTQVNNPGINGHGYLTQGDVCGGNCSQVIIRFHRGAHVGGGCLLDDLGGFTKVKTYNNTWVDYEASAHTSSDVCAHWKSASSGGSALNSIFYFPQAMTGFNPIGCEDTSCSPFNHGHNLAFATGGWTSGPFGFRYGTGAWLSDTGNLLSNPLFVSYSSSGIGDLHLQSSSPARNAGTFLTTVSGSISDSTALVVNDAGYFQDGYGITGVQGDCVSVTTVGNHICITAVNYSTNTLTLATPITATNGDSVWIYSISDGTQVLTDTAPDMGALPFTLTSGTVVNGSAQMSGSAVIQ